MKSPLCHHRFVYVLVVPVKYTVEILQNFEAFSEYMNFTPHTSWTNPDWKVTSIFCHLLKSIFLLKFLSYVSSRNIKKISRKNLKYGFDLNWQSNRITYLWFIMSFSYDPTTGIDLALNDICIFVHTIDKSGNIFIASAHLATHN